MKNHSIYNPIVMLFAAAIFVFVLSAGIAAAAEQAENTDSDNQQPSYTEYPGQIGDIARWSEVKVKEANEEYELEKAKLEAIKREQYFEDNKVEPAGNLITKDEIASLEAKRAQAEKEIRAKAGSEIQYIEAEQEASQKVTQKSPGPRPVSQPLSRGTVKGIVFYEGKGAALIAGEVVREGDVVLNVKVVKITPDFVEFEKQGTQWKQQVGQTPQTAVWEPPQTQKPAPATIPSPTPKTKKGK
jgi:hypothetical protein